MLEGARRLFASKDNEEKNFAKLKNNKKDRVLFLNSQPSKNIGLKVKYFMQQIRRIGHLKLQKRRKQKC